MEVRCNISLRDFQFWGGGKDRAKKCSAKELDELEKLLVESDSGRGWSDVEINDMFWLDFDTLAQYLGYDDEADFDLKHSHNYVNDDQLEEYANEWLEDFVKENQRDTKLMMDVMIAFGINDEWEENSVGSFGRLPNETMSNFILRKVVEDGLNVYDFIFVENDGHYCNSKIPTKEGFRKEMMKQKAKLTSPI